MSEKTAPQQTTYEVSEVELEREEYRRKQDLRARLTSVVSAIVFVLLIAFVLHISPGWPRVKQSFFSPEYFAQAWPKVLEGLLLNLKVLLAALPLTALFGTLLALIRITKSPVMFPLRVAARLYTTIMRGIPMLVVLYLIGFGIPGLGLFGRIDKAVLGTIAVVMSYSAYIAEVLRAGFEDVHPSQRASARSLGLTSNQTTWLVIIPQALRSAVLPMTNLLIAIMLTTSLGSQVPLDPHELTGIVAYVTTRNSTAGLTAFILAALGYVGTALVIGYFGNRLDKKVRILR